MAKSVVAFSLNEFDPSYTRVLIGNANFTNVNFTDLGTLEVITGGANFRESQVKDLGNLTTIGGYADFRGSQVKDLGKLKTIKGFVSFDNQELADQWKKRSNKDNFKTGGQSLSKTPAPKKERIYGSEKNKPESSKDTKSAEKIEFNEKTLETIKNKVAEHNEKNPKKKVTLASAKAVVRRGMGAYSSTHRPTISGGKPNSRVAWGLARLNAFFYKIINGKSKSGKYSQDNDLINELGYKVAKYNEGGLIKLNDFNKKVKGELKKSDYDYAKTIDEKRKVITFLYAHEYYQINNIIPLAEPDDDVIYWQLVSINGKEYIIGIYLTFHDFDNRLKITDSEITFYDVDYNELPNPIKMEEGGLIAPNGKPSNLTPEQYKLVRTKAFKDWFGDWEKDPANASKVVDENGEPKVMWHYSPNEFTIFNPSAESRWVNQRKESVVWFGGNEKVISYSEGEKGFLYQCFLNVKKPIIVDAKKYDEYDYYKDEQGNKNYSIQRIKGRFVSKLGSVSWDGKRNENDGVIFYNAWDNISLGVVVAVPNPNQIKLADGTNTTFDGNNPDIRFMAGGQVLNLNKIRKGQYEAKSDKIEISLTNPKVLNGMGTNKWQLIIEYSNDIIVNQWFDTMNEALKTGAILLSDFLDSNNTETRFMAGGRTKKAKTDKSGNPIGDGNFHVDYFVEDMTEYPQVKISVSKSDSTESVYVRYFNEDNSESITLRFSMHENNAVKFGYQLNGYTASKNDILYELGLINRKFVPNTYLSITKRQVKKVDLPKYEESNLSIKEMYDLGEGADISMHKGKIAKGSNYLIQGDTVEKIIADTGRFEYFVNGGVPKKFKFYIEEDEDEDRTEISINGVGKVILTMTYPEYEFMDDIGEDGLEELGIEEGEIIGKIEHIEINDKYKGQGYAKLLMNKAIEIAEEKGLMPLYLNASPMGSRGLDIDDLTAFYESFGFQVFLEQGNNNLMILK